MSEEKKKVLLIGSENKLATKSAEWGSDFYVGDYDIVIVDTTTLTSEKIDAVLKTNKHYFDRLRDKLFEAQHSSVSSIGIVCLVSPFITTSDAALVSDRIEKISRSNYAWSPVIPILDKLKSSEIKGRTDKSGFISKYERKIKDFYPLETYLDNAPEHLRDNKKLLVKFALSKITTNKVNKAAIFSIGWKMFDVSTSGYVSDYALAQSDAPILFFPVLPSKDEGLDIIIGAFISEDWRPEWIDKIMMPGEDAVLSDIDGLEKEVSEIEKKIEIERVHLQKFLEYKKLLFGNGRDFEVTVENALKALGAEVLEPEDKMKEDRYFEAENGIQIPIEIRGRDSREMSEEDLSQLIKRLIDRPSSEIHKTRGVFVFNHFRKTNPSERGDAFGVNIIKQAQAYNICLITGCNLYDAVCDLLAGKDMSDFKEKLLSTVGKFQPTVIED